MGIEFSGKVASKTFSCDSMDEVYGILNSVRDKFVANGHGNAPICWVASNMLSGLLDIASREKVAATLKQKGIPYFALISKDTKMNQFAAKLYNSIGLNTKIIDKLNAKFSIGVYGNLVVYVSFSPEVEQAIDKFHSSPANLTEEGVKRFLGDARVRGGYHVILINDKQMSNQYRKYVTGHFC